MYDTVCVGFGPAALALAIAMRDRNLQQRTLFLEQESQFTWTSGSADAASEISLIKDDLATMRNPRSAFTFLNYLQVTGRLQEVLSKLGSASLQQDYNDYMAWCAAQFEDWVEYGQQIMGVESVQAQPGWPVEYFQVTARDTRTGEVSQMLAKNIIIANTKEAMPTFLRPLSSILDGSSVSGQIADRNNRLRFSQGKVARTSGVWMQSSAKRGHEVSCATSCLIVYT